MDEPRLRVGLVLSTSAIDVSLDGPFSVEADHGRVPLPAGMRLSARIVDDEIRVTATDGQEIGSGDGARFFPGPGGSFVVHGMTVGLQFHWEHAEDLRFKGRLVLERSDDGRIRVVNEVLLEDYLVSVVSSEMSATCPEALLRAHAVISRSWLVAQIEAAGRPVVAPPPPVDQDGILRIVRWYDRQQHAGFDVCADDHCQRYQGITRALTPTARAAVEATRGVFLVHDGAVCDARFSKCCGGLTEVFPAAWSDGDVPYLQSFHDQDPPSLTPVPDPDAFLRASPPAFCNCHDRALLERILPSLDHATQDFYRWQVTLTRDEVRDLATRKLGVDPGPVLALTPLERGPSGRVTLLEVRGEKRTIHVGKELEIRRMLSPTHLYSSAFVVDAGGEGFTLHGAGWGHGVGLCQIGAAVMAEKGYDHEAILRHYYRSTTLEKRYD